MSQDSIIIYRDIREAVMGLPPELCKEVMKAIFDYAFDDIEPPENTDAVVKGFFLAFKSRFDMNVARLERNKTNGKKGGNPNFAKGKRNPYYPIEDNLEAEDNQDITQKITQEITEDNPKITQTTEADNQEINEDNPTITEKQPKDKRKKISQRLPKHNPNITENTEEDNREISEDKPYLYPYLYNNSVVDVDNAHTRESEGEDYKKFLAEFFDEAHRAQIEVICMQLHTDPDTLHRDADEVVAEWELTKTTHRDYKEQSQHLINQLRIKYRTKLQDNGRSKKQAAGAATAKDGLESVCEPPKKKKALRSTI